jgi:hypothetical protein
MTETSISDADRRESFINTLSETGKLTEAREKAGISYYLLTKWRKEYPDFEARIQDCQEAYIERMFDKLDSALEIYPNPQQAKVFSDNLRWKLAKLRPDKFGDRLDVKATLTVDLTDRFAQAVERLAKNRQRPSRDLVDKPQAGIIDITPTAAPPAPDMQSDSAADSDLTGRRQGQRQGDCQPILDSMAHEPADSPAAPPARDFK